MKKYFWPNWNLWEFNLWNLPLKAIAPVVHKAIYNILQPIILKYQLLSFIIYVSPTWFRSPVSWVQRQGVEAFSAVLSIPILFCHSGEGGCVVSAGKKLCLETKSSLFLPGSLQEEGPMSAWWSCPTPATSCSFSHSFELQFLWFGAERQ